MLVSDSAVLPLLVGAQQDALQASALAGSEALWDRLTQQQSSSTWEDNRVVINANDDIKQLTAINDVGLRPERKLNAFQLGFCSMIHVTICTGSKRCLSSLLAATSRCCQPTPACLPACRVNVCRASARCCRTLSNGGVELLHPR